MAVQKASNSTSKAAASNADPKPKSAPKVPAAKPVSSQRSKVKPRKEEKFEVKLPSLQELLEVGAHFGHKKSRWNPLMKKYIFDTREGIHIIDLTQTLDLLKEAVEFLHSASKKGMILLVGSKGQAATLIKNAGNDHGAFYISRRWPGGLLTNFKSVRKSIRRMMEMEDNIASHQGYETKKERLVMIRDLERLSRLYEGIRFMDEMPSAMVVIDTRIEKNAIMEANKLGIPVVGLIDTNCNPSLIDYPVPANDDAISSIELFVNVIVQGFTSSPSSAKLIGKRNDRISKLDKMTRDAEAEEERLRREEEMERQRIKDMKEGKKVGSDVVRIVRKVERPSGQESKPEAGASESTRKTVRVTQSQTKTIETKEETKKESTSPTIRRVIKKTVEKKASPKAKAAKKASKSKTATKKKKTTKKTVKKAATRKTTKKTAKSAVSKAKKTTKKKAAKKTTSKK